MRLFFWYHCELIALKVFSIFQFVTVWCSSNPLWMNIPIGFPVFHTGFQESVSLPVFCNNVCCDYLLYLLLQPCSQPFLYRVLVPFTWKVSLFLTAERLNLWLIDSLQSVYKSREDTQHYAKHLFPKILTGKFDQILMRTTIFLCMSMCSYSLELRLNGEHNHPTHIQPWDFGLLFQKLRMYVVNHGREQDLNTSSVFIFPVQCWMAVFQADYPMTGCCKQKEEACFQFQAWKSVWFLCKDLLIYLFERQN